MIRYISLLLFIGLTFWDCEDKTDDKAHDVVDDTPTEVTLWGVVYSIEFTTSLNLSISQLTGSIPPDIEKLIHLTYLNLGGNQITGEIPPEMGNLTNLTYLNLGGNQLMGEIPSEIGNLNKLTDLSFGSNQLTGVIPEIICDLNINWNNSDYFRISYNQLCPPYPSCIEDYMGEQDTTNCD